jgi:16S rRNA (guanine527-N7)-methyltransferase
MNLTSIQDPAEIIERHFVECAFAADNLPPVTTMLDFGSGAGFPGIPIAICRPEIQVVLAESQSKKAAFLSEALRTLAISGEVYPGRVEAISLDRSFDLVTLRAVDKMPAAILAARSRAQRFLALFAAQNGSGYQRLAPEFAWKQPLPLPPRERAVLLVGERSRPSV